MGEQPFSAAHETRIQAHMERVARECPKSIGQSAPPWSQAETDELLRLWPEYAGQKTAERCRCVATRMGKTIDSVRRKAQTLGLLTKAKGG